MTGVRSTLFSDKASIPQQTESKTRYFTLKQNMKQEKKTTFPELTENEKKLFEAVTKVSCEEVRTILQEKDVKVDCLDDSGMTPLQHAAFRAKYDTAELLLSHGADVNSNYHENGYTALMFAALSGNTEVTRLMLQHGAKKDRANTVGRNACQMAAFVGQHQCVAVINNYYEKSELEYYTIARGQEKEPKLPPMVLPALLKLLNMANMNPVKVSFHLQENPEMMNESYKVCKVLDLISEKAMKAREPDDVIAIKTHYFATIIRKAKDNPNMDIWIKWLVKGRDVDGHPESQDKVIRQALKEFPFVDSVLLQNMVRQLSMTKLGDSPTSLNILNQGVNGQKFNFDVEQECSTCSEPNAKKCVKCKMAYYCNAKCQRLHWSTHKKFCAKLAVEYIEQEKLREENKKREEEEKRQEEIKKEEEKKKQEEIARKNKEQNKNGDDTTVAEQGDTKVDLGLPDGVSMPDIEKILQNEEIAKAYQNPELIKALEEISVDPRNIEKYKDNEDLIKLIQTIPDKVLELTGALEDTPTDEQTETPAVTADGGYMLE